MKIVFASHNQGKIRELQTLISESHLNWELIPQAELFVDNIPETGLTFVENALLKARHASQVTGLPAIADDSGLEVFALKGAPGIYSARYAGKNATSSANIAKLLEELRFVPEKNRRAAFQCVLVYLNYFDDPTPIISQGTWEGSILQAPQGEQGFGYDPIFFDPIQNSSAAELPLAIKNKISHRGKALNDLLAKMIKKVDQI